MDPIREMLRLMTHINIGATLALLGWPVALAQPPWQLPGSSQTGATLPRTADVEGGR